MAQDIREAVKIKASFWKKSEKKRKLADVISRPSAQYKEHKQHMLRWLLGNRVHNIAAYEYNVECLYLFIYSY